MQFLLLNMMALNTTI